ncbi:MAG TPA: DUF2934 domain-containing protein [Verrucomicrobiae bacterium]|nr:DUF2934 domain-containing protein [Verrucomicrobiae bacterium]
MPKSKAVTAGSAKKPQKASIPPTYEEIALRAYHIYLERGCTPGDPMQDWLRAEQELLDAAGRPKRKSKIVSIAA